MAGDLSEVSWNVDMEVNLFHAMRGHKPVGTVKYSTHFSLIRTLDYG